MNFSMIEEEKSSPTKTKDEDMELYTNKEKFEYLNLSAIQFYTGLIFDELPDGYFNDPSYYTLHPSERPMIKQIIDNVEKEIKMAEHQYFISIINSSP
jgi:hypothetical protein